MFKYLLLYKGTIHYSIEGYTGLKTKPVSLAVHPRDQASRGCRVSAEGSAAHLSAEQRRQVHGLS